MPTPDLSKDATDFIMKMQPKHAKQVLLKILALCNDPKPPDSTQLKGNAECYRCATSGEYRIIYRVAGDVLEVHLVGKCNGDDVYRQFERK